MGFNDDTQATRPTEPSILVRINHLDLSRVTEQTALVMSLLQGKGAERTAQVLELVDRVTHDSKRTFSAPTVKPIKRLALESALGFLHEAYCIGGIPKELRFEKESLKNVWAGMDFPFGHMVNELNNGGGSHLDLVTLPIDGAQSLVKGLGGAASFLAGAPAGSFVSSPKSRYLVVTMNPSFSGTRKQVNDFVSSIIRNSKMKKLLLCEVIQQIVAFASETAGKPYDEFALGCMDRKKEHRIRISPSFISVLCRLRKFTGSTVIGALSPYLPELEISAFVDEADPVQATIIAAGAQATNCPFFACALPDELPDGEKSLLEGSYEFFDASHFVKASDVFVIATGITDSFALRGIRFLGDDRAETESLCLREFTRSQRKIRATHNAIDQRKFRMLDRSTLKRITYNDLDQHVRKKLTRKRPTPKPENQPTKPKPK